MDSLVWSGWFELRVTLLGWHSRISNPTRRAKYSIGRFHSTRPSSFLPRVTTLALS